MARERAQNLQTSWSPDRGPASKEAQYWMREDKRASRSKSRGPGKAENQKIQKEKEAVKAVMTLVLDEGMTNDPNDILRIYRENKQRCTIDIAGGEGEVSRLVYDFFSDMNTVQRLVLFKTVLNKSKRRAEVPLYQFYVNMLPEERRIYMVEKPSKPMVQLKPEEIVTCKEGNKPKTQMSPDEYMCHIFMLDQIKKGEE